MVVAADISAALLRPHLTPSKCDLHRPSRLRTGYRKRVFIQGVATAASPPLSYSRLMNKTLISIIALTTLLSVFAIACGSNSGDGPHEADQLQKITASDRIFTAEDFLAIGMKKSKEYDVTGLTGATSAIYGFWKPGGGESVEYEIRFYPSHDEAVSNGTSFADEVTGPDGAVASDDVTWKEGTRDRRTSGFTIGGGGGSLAVKYGDYIIHSNVLILCQGRDSAQSLDRCWALINRALGIDG